MKKFVEYFFSYDPGLSRMRLAIRTTLSTAFSAFILSYIADLVHQPVTMVFIGISVALYGALMINDPSIKDQKITTFLLPIPASICLIIGTFAAPYHYFSIILFLFLTFGCVSGRRYGPRFIALSMVGFMSYFGAIYFKAQIYSIPWMILAVFIGTGVTYVFQFWLSLSRPKWILHWYLAAFDARLVQTLRHLGKSLINRSDSLKNRLQLRHDLTQVTDAALSLEDLLKTGDIETQAALATQVFETEFTLGRLLECVRVALQIGDLDKETTAELSKLLHLMAEKDPSCFQNIKNISLKWESEKIESDALENLRLALDDFLKNQANIQLKESSLESPKISKELFLAGPPSKENFNIFTKHAIQATLAVGLSSIIGDLLSPTRWAWAAVAAFVVFSGANRGETFSKSGLRILGTSIGLIVGLFLAQIQLNKNIDIGIIFISIFLGAYFIRVAYGWTTMWFTLMVFGLYKFLGILNTEILILRLEETFIGVFFATLAAIFIFPTYTQREIGVAVVKLLYDLSNVLKKCAKIHSGENLTEYSRILDRDLKNVRIQAQPMLKGLPNSYSEQVKGLVHDTFALVNYARVLTVSLSRHLEDESLRLALHLRCNDLAQKSLNASTELGEYLNQNRSLNIFGQINLMALPQGGSDPHSRAHLSLDRIELLIESILVRFKVNSPT